MLVCYQIDRFRPDQVSLLSCRQPACISRHIPGKEQDSHPSLSMDLSLAPLRKSHRVGFPPLAPLISTPSMTMGKLPSMDARSVDGYRWRPGSNSYPKGFPRNFRYIDILSLLRSPRSTPRQKCGCRNHHWGIDFFISHPSLLEFLSRPTFIES